MVFRIIRKMTHPCGHAGGMNNDSGFKGRLQSLADEVKNGATNENGYMRRTNGSTLTPTNRWESGVEYSYYASEVFTERVHTHTGGPAAYSDLIISDVDIFSLAELYKNGNIARGEADNFRYAVISSFGVMGLQITDEAAFKAFVYSLYDMAGSTRSNFSEALSSLSRSVGNIDGAIGGLIGVLNSYNTGLSISFSHGLNVADLSFQPKELNGSVVVNPCR